MDVFFLILGIILILILLLLFCPIAVKISFDNELKLSVGYIFPLIRIPLAKGEEQDPEKARKKAEKQKKKEEKKRKKAEKNKDKAKQTEEEKKASLFSRIKSKGLGGIIELLKELAEIVTTTVKKITSHLVIYKMDLELAIASEDAAQTAMNYGYACSAVFPLVSVIEQNVKKCRHRENIYPVFTRTDTQVYFVMKLRIIPIFLLSALLSALFRSVKLYKEL